VYLGHILQHSWQRWQRTEGRRDGSFPALGGHLEEDATRVPGGLVRLEADEQVHHERQQGVVHGFFRTVREEDTCSDQEESNSP
jgi:hypothetical protein